MTTKQDTVDKIGVSALKMPIASRAFLVGKTGTGKSTLMEVLMREYQIAYSKTSKLVRTLIVDTKPRWKAERELNGLTTKQSGRYRKWGYGSGTLPGSYVLSGKGKVFDQLEQVWSFGGTIAIVQTERESEWPSAIEAARGFYEQYGADIPRLIVVDELADFYNRSNLADIFQRVARNGRERNCALLSGSQRPRKIPVEILTEMTRLYQFELDNKDDLNRVEDMGIPQHMLPTGHAFYLWDKELKYQYPSDKYYELDLSSDIYTGEKK